MTKLGSARLIAVLGYSSRRGGDELHRVCAARLVRAGREALPGDTVFLSGWRRPRRPISEAELMAGAWNGDLHQVLVDDVSRSTYGNVRAAAAAARKLGVSEVVLVTSGWHSRRASVLLEAAYGDRVSLAATGERGTRFARARELVCWLVVPVQVALARRSR
ncbi:MAG: YdcF family protein [Actinobacteria bacterium]|nr:YdcF family protein [Actinomycetota bacterium]